MIKTMLPLKSDKKFCANQVRSYIEPRIYFLNCKTFQRVNTQICLYI